MHNTCIKILVEFQVETDSLSYMYYQVSVNIKYKQNESLRVTDMPKQFFQVLNGMFPVYTIQGVFNK